MRDLGFFLRLFARRLPWLVAGTALMLATALAGIGLLGLSGWFVAAAALSAGAAGFDLLRPSAGIRFLALFRTASRYGERLATHEATFRVLADLRAWLFARAARLDAAQLGRLRSGDLLARMTADVDALDTLYLRILAPAVVAAAVAVLAFAAIGSVDLVVALAVVGGMVLAGVAVPLLARRLGEPLGREIVSVSAGLRDRLVRDIQGAAELRVFGAAARAAEPVHAAVAVLADLQRRMGRIAGLSAAMTALCSGATLLAALALGAALVTRGGMPPALLAGLVLAVIGLFEVVAPLPSAFQLLGRTAGAARRLREVAEMEPAIRDPETPAPPPPGTGVAFRGVRFAYDAGGPAVLSGFDLDLPQGRRLAVLGPSGSGKSTIARLLLRLWDPDAGTVALGGVDLRRLRQADLHARIGYLSQSEPLFNATIRDNLLVGRADADDPALWSVLAEVRLADFVRDLPDGLDTWVGEAGTMLSGGQARRLALGRVLLEKAPVLVLDEPTEGLDAETEAEVWAALARHMEGRTVLLITHRPAGLAAMHEVRRLEGGRLA
ncbi:thiol reductant ABC exporter subunit CydC [Arenibaculum sp.]|uniref:thiol reductant ABC exporter subunit CydC n=1 Tax=Arenibaculum sp. TaxID=2865862 RepID=UPI002E136D46|nr:thiol reductant ABC exporter subunit CydC [Arenibaculum sp.]